MTQQVSQLRQPMIDDMTLTAVQCNRVSAAP